MTRHRGARPALTTGVVSLLVVAIFPAVLLVGELVSRHYLSALRARPGARRGPGRLPGVFLANPVWIALTAPSRWILDQLRPLAGGRRGGKGGNGPPGAGVREPRRPLPDLPAGEISLPEPH